MTALGLGQEDAAKQQGELAIPFKEEFFTLFRNKPAMVAAAVIDFLVIVAVLAPYDPALQDHELRLKPPSAVHWMGTDLYGRDSFSRLLYGARVSLMVGVFSVLFGMLVGVPLGIVSGYYGGRWTASSCASWMPCWPSLH